MRKRAARPRSSSCLALVASVLLAGLLAACGQNVASTTPAPPPASVVVSPAALRDISSQRSFTGRIEAIDKVQIRARVQGFLKSRIFAEGAEVKNGDLLFEIEPEPFELAVQQAEANVASARAAETLAQQNFERIDELASRNTASRASLDDARSKLAQAQASGKARVAELETARLNLKYTKIVAPMDGRVGRTAYSVGNLVGLDSQPLVALVSQDTVYVSFPVPQWLLVQVKKAGRGPDSVYVKLQLADGSDYEHHGQISFTEVQATSATDSVLVRATVPNPERLLVDQQLINVQVVRKKPDQKLVISQSGLLLDQQGAYVLAVDTDDKVRIKRITIGEQRGPLIVVEGGLVAGDRVIISGHQKARPGEKVAPQLDDSPAGALATGDGKKAL